MTRRIDREIENFEEEGEVLEIHKEVGGRECIDSVMKAECYIITHH